MANWRNFIATKLSLKRWHIIWWGRWVKQWPSWVETKMRRGGVAAAKQSQVSELIDRARQIIQQRNNPSRDLGNQQSSLRSNSHR